MARTFLRWRWTRLTAALLVPTLHISAQNAPEAGALKPGSAIDRTITGNQEHFYRFSLAPAECAHIIVEQRGVDVVAQVLTAQSRLIAEYDFESRPYGREVLDITADSATDYLLKIKPRYGRAPNAPYEVRISIEPASDKTRATFEAHRLSAEAATLEAEGKYDQAIPIAEEALAIAQKAGADDAYTGYLLFKVAGLYRIKQNYSKSLEIFREAIAADEKSGGKENPQRAYALEGLGRLYLEHSDYSDAEPILLEAVDVLERTLGKENGAVAVAIRNVANLRGYREDLERSAADLKRALAIAEKAYDPDDIVVIAIVHDLGNVYEVMDDGDRAEPLLQRSIDWLEKRYGPEHAQLATPLANLGAVAIAKHQYQRALGLLLRAKAIREKSLGPQNTNTISVVMSLANIYNCLGEYQKALETEQQALDTLLSAVGPQHRLVWVAYEGLARFHAAQGDFPAAVEYQKRFEEVLDKYGNRNLVNGSEREKLAYFSWDSSQVDRTISLNIVRAPANQSATDLAALSLLRHKGRVLDMVSGSMNTLRERMDPEDRKLLDQLEENRTKLASISLGGAAKAPVEYQKQISSLEDQGEKLETAISARSAEFRAQSQPVTLNAVRSAVPADAALIELGSFRPFDPHGNERSDAYEKPHYVAYVIRRTGEVQGADLGPVKEIDEIVAKFREALRDSRRTDVNSIARALDDRVMRPIRARMGDAQHLLISPDGSLNLIPFEALVDEQGQYLVQRYSVSYLTSGRDLLRMQIKRVSQNPPVIAADPFFGESAVLLSSAKPPVATKQQGAKRRSVTTGQDLSTVYFAPLPGTADEARGIKTLFPDATVFTGADATKDSLKKINSPSILHIATHGFFLDDANLEKQNPLLRSGLALAGANKGGVGILTALEAANLNLWGTQVVTLSACETGVGEVKNGEGVYGLRRSFMLAGAETLVMSLWPVSDRVTRDMMLAYYTGLKQGVSRAAALRQAELSMLKRKERQHPFFWASFIQSGQWKSLDGK